jgi:hypothetical protein
MPISPRVENKALLFLCLISVEHAQFPILCQNMSKITCIYRMTAIAKIREPIQHVLTLITMIIESLSFALYIQRQTPGKEKTL